MAELAGVNFKYHFRSKFLPGSRLDLESVAFPTDERHGQHD